MADLNYWFGSVDLVGVKDDTIPAMAFDERTNRCLVGTLEDCSASTPTPDVPDFTGGGRTPVMLIARGGDLSVTVGDNPTAVDKDPQTLFLPQNVPMSMVVTAGKIIAAIDAL